jgi:hypothetical protein
MKGDITNYFQKLIAPQEGENPKAEVCHVEKEE